MYLGVSLCVLVYLVLVYLGVFLCSLAPLCVYQCILIYFSLVYLGAFQSISMYLSFWVYFSVSWCILKYLNMSLFGVFQCIFRVFWCFLVYHGAYQFVISQCNALYFGVFRCISLFLCGFRCICRRNATHCISPYAIVMCVCLSVCVYVCMPRLWTSGKRFELETSFFSELLGMTRDITCKSFTQIGLQIPRWRTKWRPWNTIIGRNSAIY